MKRTLATLCCLSFFVLMFSTLRAEEEKMKIPKFSAANATLAEQYAYLKKIIDTPHSKLNDSQTAKLVRDLSVISDLVNFNETGYLNNQTYAILSIRARKPLTLKALLDGKVLNKDGQITDQNQRPEKKRADPDQIVAKKQNVESNDTQSNTSSGKKKTEKTNTGKEKTETKCPTGYKCTNALMAAQEKFQILAIQYLLEFDADPTIAIDGPLGAPISACGNYPFCLSKMLKHVKDKKISVNKKLLDETYDLACRSMGGGMRGKHLSADQKKKVQKANLVILYGMGARFSLPQLDDDIKPNECGKNSSGQKGPAKLDKSIGRSIVSN
jgi:hypothetical protein